MALDVSVIVCSKNAEATIVPCLESVRANDPRQVIVVDGLSTDRTLALAHSYADCLASDEGKGIAHARNVGLDRAYAEYVCYVGADNVLPSGFLKEMIWQKEAYGWAGISAMTRLKGKGWWNRQMDCYKRARYYPGERSVIGTPHLWERKLLVEICGFDAGLTSSDDADLCERLGNAGYRVGVADLEVEEIGTTAWLDVRRRWLWYGQSDAEYYQKYSAGWGWRRKVKSVTHPLRSEFLGPMRKDARLMPFCGLVTAVRYAGWLKARRNSWRTN